MPCCTLHSALRTPPQLPHITTRYKTLHPRHTKHTTTTRTQECARYLELFKAYEQKPAAAIQGRSDTDYVGRLTSALTSVRGVNRNDAYAVGSAFGTLADAFKAGAGDFAAVPGLGPVKARRLHDAFSQPFRRALVAGGGGGGGGGGAGGSGAAGAAGAAGGVAAAAAAGGSGAAPATAAHGGGGAAAAAAAAEDEEEQEERAPAGALVAVELPISDEEGGDESDGLDDDDGG